MYLHTCVKFQVSTINSYGTKPLEVVEPSANVHYTETAEFELPPAKGDCKYIDADNAAELIAILHNEAKVI